MRAQSTNWMPSLKVPRVSLMKRTSSMPSRSLNSFRCGTVDSPTPIVPTFSDSTRRIAQSRPRIRARPAAAIQPAVPPPTMTTCWIAEPIMRCGYLRPLSRQPVATRSRDAETRGRRCGLTSSSPTAAVTLELQPHGYPERARVTADVAVRVVDDRDLVHLAIRAEILDIIDVVLPVEGVDQVDAHVGAQVSVDREVLGGLEVDVAVAEDLAADQETAVARREDADALAAPAVGRIPVHVRRDGAETGQVDIRIRRRQRQLGAHHEAPRAIQRAGHDQAMPWHLRRRDEGVVPDGLVVEGVLIGRIAVVVVLGGMAVGVGDRGAPVRFAGIGFLDRNQQLVQMGFQAVAAEDQRAEAGHAVAPGLASVLPES